MPKETSKAPGRTCLARSSLALILLAGCTPTITLRRVDDSTWFAKENRTALEGPQWSERTRQFLRREDLSTAVYRDMEAVLKTLHQRLVEERDRELAFHLAELCFVHAKTRGSEQESVRFDLSTAIYSYAYLFDGKLDPPATGYDPAFRWVCDFHNRSLAKVVAFATKHRLGRSENPRLKLLEGNLALLRGHSDYPFEPDEFTKLLVAFNYEVVGLPGSSRSYGLGVPLILVRPATGTEAALKPSILAWLSSGPVEEIALEQSYAATLVLRIPGSICDLTGPDAALNAWFEVYDPTRTTSIKIGESIVPLEADLTSPLAYALGQAPEYSGLRALFRTAESSKEIKLFLLQLYDPEKIPVVFVHGLLSSPVTWMKLLNDLLSDPVLRERYQFWFFQYPTGNPIPVSAALLRTSLLEMQKSYDPDRKNAHFQDMVIVGHSMGGLLTKLQVLETGNRIWNKLSDKPIDELDLSRDEKVLMKTVLYYDALPFLKRVVFMAVPHRGSEEVTSWYSRLAQKLIELPGRVRDTTKGVLQTMTEPVRRSLGLSSGTVTGLTGLAPDSLMAKEVSKLPLPEGLPVHSIIGNKKAADTPGGTDGHVPYESSHLDGVQSEKIIHSGHNVQEHPAALKELQRILHLHLAEFDAGVKPAADGAGTGDG